MLTSLLFSFLYWIKMRIPKINIMNLFNLSININIDTKVFLKNFLFQQFYLFFQFIDEMIFILWKLCFSNFNFSQFIILIHLINALLQINFKYKILIESFLAFFL